jgi:uncharacterized cupredoxin-like copper-binding protein
MWAQRPTSPLSSRHPASCTHDATIADGAPAAVLTVAAGQPSEFTYLLSSQTVAEGVATFQISNAGVLPHDFEDCAVPSDGTATTCSGTDTSPLAPGSSATLTVTFTSPGTYEYLYLCTLPGHAAAGMRGLITMTS